jgi:hypothetical protein
VITATNKRLHISESCGDSNRCTPYRGNPVQHDMYASHANPRTPDVCFLRAVPVRGNLSWVINRVEQSHYSREKGLPTKFTTRRLTDPRVHTQFLSWANQWSSWESHTSINNMLLGLPDPYHKYTIGMFNTCSWGSIHRSLTDTGGGYNLGGAGLPRTTPGPSQSAVSHVHLRAPAGLQFNQVLATKPKCRILMNLWPPRGPLSHLP